MVIYTKKKSQWYNENLGNTWRRDATASLDYRRQCIIGVISTFFGRFMNILFFFIFRNLIFVLYIFLIALSVSCTNYKDRSDT